MKNSIRYASLFVAPLVIMIVLVAGCCERESSIQQPVSKTYTWPSSWKPYILKNDDGYWLRLRHEHVMTDIRCLDFEDAYFVLTAIQDSGPFSDDLVENLVQNGASRAVMEDREKKAKPPKTTVQVPSAPERARLEIALETTPCLDIEQRDYGVAITTEHKPVVFWKDGKWQVLFFDLGEEPR